MWRASVRFGYVYGALEWAGGLASQTEALWSAATLNAVTRLFEEEWRAAMAGPDRIRFVLHRDLDDEGVQRCLDACSDFSNPRTESIQ